MGACIDIFMYIWGRVYIYIYIYIYIYNIYIYIYIYEDH